MSEHDTRREYWIAADDLRKALASYAERFTPSSVHGKEDIRHLREVRAGEITLTRDELFYRLLAKGTQRNIADLVCDKLFSHDGPLPEGTQANG